MIGNVRVVRLRREVLNDFDGKLTSRGAPSSELLESADESEETATVVYRRDRLWDLRGFNEPKERISTNSVIFYGYSSASKRIMVGKRGEREDMTDVLLCCCCQRFTYENNYSNADQQLFLFCWRGVKVENQLWIQRAERTDWQRRNLNIACSPRRSTYSVALWFICHRVRTKMRAVDNIRFAQQCQSSANPDKPIWKWLDKQRKHTDCTHGKYVVLESFIQISRIVRSTLILPVNRRRTWPLRMVFREREKISF